MRVLTDHLSAVLGLGGIAAVLALRAFLKLARFVVIAAIAAVVVAVTHGMQ
jgi:hypothetical protein